MSLRIAILLAAWSVAATADEPDHWAFQPLRPIAAPASIDHFVAKALQVHGLTKNPPADRSTVLRRLTYDLVGLPPTPEELAEFSADDSPEAFERAVDRLLASPRYGERWGKFWLDAVGYADSNGYFNADSNRPLAYKYRDYVVRSLNADKPYDQFVRGQLAGDELSGFRPGGPMTPDTIELLTATHFLRNAQDGTSESDGNPDEVTIDRATVLEGALQVTMNSLLAVTIQCARCHEHKFEPIAQAEYYGLQAIFYPAFPAFHPERWSKPVGRVMYAATPEALAAWEATQKRLDDEVTQLRREFAAWIKSHRPAGTIRFQDDFDRPNEKVVDAWSQTAPGDDAPGGSPLIQLDGKQAPAAVIENGSLRIIDSGPGNRWLSTKQSFDWTPENEGEWVQATFDLVDDKVAGSTPAARVGFYIAMHDFNDNGPTAGGNILLDGNPAGGAAVYFDYPGADQRQVGVIGTSGYKPGRNYGVRVTNVGGGKFRLEQLVDWVVEEKSHTFTVADLPDGGFGFEFVGGRNFIVDSVVIEGTSATAGGDESARKSFLAEYQRKRQELEKAVQAKNAQRTEKPGQLAFASDLMVPAPDVFVLKRGLYGQRGERVEPAGLAALGSRSGFETNSSHSTGRRLAFANWITQPDSRPAALLSRVIVNRLWQHHFGRGLVATPDNFGRAGAKPSHPELLEFLASELVASGWSLKSLHRRIVLSDVYRQSSAPQPSAAEIDADNRWLWRYPLRRLDAEAVRDSLLAVSGDLDLRLYGPYVPTQREGDGNIIVSAKHPDARRRGLYIQQRRTQTNTFLELFDAPAMAVTCGERGRSTVPLQSLTLLNSPFVRERAAALARRVKDESEPEARVDRVFLLTTGRLANAVERDAVTKFLDEQSKEYGSLPESGERAWADLCQMLLASNAFLYAE